MNETIISELKELTKLVERAQDAATIAEVGIRLAALSNQWRHYHLGADDCLLACRDVSNAELALTV